MIAIRGHFSDSGKETFEAIPQPNESFGISFKSKRHFTDISNCIVKTFKKSQEFRKFILLPHSPSHPHSHAHAHPPVAHPITSHSTGESPISSVPSIAGA